MKSPVEEKVVEALTELFRAQGYEGASLSQLMSATGLVKASLYHRFKGGKEEMALAALDYVAGVFANHVLAPLAAEGEPRARLAQTISRLKVFYASGGKACLLETMSLAANPAIRERASGALQFWIGAFARFARSNGLPAALAQARAEEAVVSIEGSLVLARVSGNRRIFHRALDRLPALLLDKTYN